MSRAGVVQLDVHVQLSGDTVRAGTAYISERRGTTSTSFVYDPAYLGRRDAFSISPDLPVTVSSHQVAGLPGAVADTAPDRWGRNLIDKRVRYRARDERPPATVREVDYLLGVADLTRQGALRYTAADDVVFLAPDPNVPRLIELPRLLRAADRVASDGDSDDLAEVKLLLDAGTGSLGGARPKASVRDGGGVPTRARCPWSAASTAHRSTTWRSQSRSRHTGATSRRTCASSGCAPCSS